MSRKTDGTCVAAPGSAAPGPASTAAAATPINDEAALCQRACERDLECKAEAADVAGPEGAGRERLLRLCRRTCEFMITDFNRAQLRECVALPGCTEFSECVGPPDEEAGGF